VLDLISECGSQGATTRYVSKYGDISSEDARLIAKRLKGRGLIEAECPDGHWIYRTVKLP